MDFEIKNLPKADWAGAAQPGIHDSEQLRILMGIGRTAAAENFQRFRSSIPDLMRCAGPDANGIPAFHSKMFIPQMHKAISAQNMV